MNENIDLTKILKDCPKGTKFYSPIFGEVEFEKIGSHKEDAIIITKGVITSSFTKEGFYYADLSEECILFPSKEQRDWSKFTAPWYKKERFDPKTLKPFDKVLACYDDQFYWCCELFSFIEDDTSCTKCCGDYYKYCIPYNDETKHLVGTTDEAPEFYRYWEE